MNTDFVKTQPVQTLLDRASGVDVEGGDRRLKAITRDGTVVLSLVSTLPWLSFMVLPYEISVMGTAFGLSQGHASWIATAEMLALALSAVASARTVARKDKRLATGVGMAIASVGAAASLGPSTLALFVLARILFGGGLGVVAAATNALPADHEQPERIYAFMMVALALVFWPSSM